MRLVALIAVSCFLSGCDIGSAQEEPIWTYERLVELKPDGQGVLLNEVLSGNREAVARLVDLGLGRELGRIDPNCEFGKRLRESVSESRGVSDQQLYGVWLYYWSCHSNPILGHPDDRDIPLIYRLLRSGPSESLPVVCVRALLEAAFARKPSQDTCEALRSLYREAVVLGEGDRPRRASWLLEAAKISARGWIGTDREVAFDDAARAFAACEDEAGGLRCLEERAAVLLEGQGLSEAKQFYAELFELFSERGDYFGAARAAAGMARCSSGNPEEAVEALEKASQACLAAGMRWSSLGLRLLQAEITLSSTSDGDLLERAQECLAPILADCVRLKDCLGEARTRVHWAQALAARSSSALREAALEHVELAEERLSGATDSRSLEVLGKALWCRFELESASDGGTNAAELLALGDRSAGLLGQAGNLPLQAYVIFCSTSAYNPGVTRKATWSEVLDRLSIAEKALEGTPYKSMQAGTSYRKAYCLRPTVNRDGDWTEAARAYRLASELFYEAAQYEASGDMLYEWVVCQGHGDLARVPQKHLHQLGTAARLIRDGGNAQRAQELNSLYLRVCYPQVGEGGVGAACGTCGGVGHLPPNIFGPAPVPCNSCGGTGRR